MPSQLRPAVPCQHPGPGYIYDANGHGRWCLTCEQPLNDVRPGGFGLPAMMLVLALLSMGVAIAFLIHGRTQRAPGGTDGGGVSVVSSREAPEPEPTPYPSPGKPVIRWVDGN